MFKIRAIAGANKDTMPSLVSCLLEWKGKLGSSFTFLSFLDLEMNEHFFLKWLHQGAVCSYLRLMYEVNKLLSFFGIFLVLIVTKITTDL